MKCWCKKSPELVRDKGCRYKNSKYQRCVQDNLERRTGMREHEMSPTQIRLDWPREKRDDIEPAARQDDKGNDDTNEHCPDDPEQAMPQLLEVIEERHLRV